MQTLENYMDDLPTYSDAELASLDWEAMRALMTRDEDRVPRNVIDECVRRGEAMLEPLKTLVEDGADWNLGSLGEWWLKLHAVMILGLIPGENAGQLLAEFMCRMSIEDDKNLQEWLGGYWPALFRNKPESALSLVKTLSEERKIGWYMRSYAMETCVARAQEQGVAEFERALEWAAALAADESEDWDFRLSVGNTLLDYPRNQYRPLLEDLADRQDDFFKSFSKKDVEHAYAGAEDKVDRERLSDPWIFYSPDEIEIRQVRWMREDEAMERSKDYKNLRGDDFMPYVREQPKLGRNDPCHCGSGKKYKKCCLDANCG